MPTLASIYATGEMRHAEGPATTGQSAADLQRELELLAYVTSHNLQAPLRAILSCCEDMQLHQDSASAGQLAAEASRLKAMMQLMVDYIQLETHPVRHNHVDMNEVMETVRGMLAVEIEQAKARIFYDTLPVVWGHHGRLTRLMAYLLDNAIKFRSHRPCVVKITVRAVESGLEISVADNGIGIDEDNQELVFRLFKRLHTQEEYPGYGAGLALAHKIVSSHGGTIALESAKDQGSRFFFILPRHG